MSENQAPPSDPQQPVQPMQPPQPGYPPQQGYYAPQPGGYPPPQQPVKKSHTLRNVLIAVLLVFILFIGGCIALIGGAAKEIDKAIDEVKSQDAQPGGPDNPMAIKAGEAFEVSGFAYQPGWSVRTDALGDLAVKGLKVENNRDGKDSALVEIKFWKGTEVLALSDCTSDPIDPGTTVSLSCFSGDKLPKNYDKITINDTF